ncbi:MAG: hypothetical protein ACRECH_10995 [Nitrososphaerales archaeon]
MKRVWILALFVLVFIAGTSLSGIILLSQKVTTRTVSTSTIFSTTTVTQTYLKLTDSNFSDAKALGFYQKINTTTGLLSDFPSDTTIYLADDQVLDYYSLTILQLHR